MSLNTYRPDYVIAGIGEILWDVFPSGKKVGGAPANFAYHTRVQGARSEVVSCIGDDDSGREIITHLKKIGLSDNYIFIDNQHPTGWVDIDLDDDGKPNFTIHEQVAWDYIPFTDELRKFATQVNAVCFGSLAQRSAVSRSAIRSFLQNTPEKSLRVLDINLRQQYYDAATIKSCLRMANCLKLNEDELPVVQRLLGLKGSADKVVNHLVEEYGLVLLALTMGSRGSRLLGVGEDSFLESPKVDVVDTVGAGDAFTAAMVIGFLENYPIPVIHKKANFLSAYVCTQTGATPDIPQNVLSNLKNL
jgi:fructokinase